MLQSSGRPEGPRSVYLNGLSAINEIGVIYYWAYKYADAGHLDNIKLLKYIIPREQ